MCGIAGFFDPLGRVDPAASERALAAMRNALAHRGPDGGGAWRDRGAGAALGFRRLAILDLSPAGDQPMISHDGRMVMIFNGEIYNHRELRAALDGPGRVWRGHSDSESLLEAIARWGMVAALERANGMFAIALWDIAARRLWLARDRFGEKPLYYGWCGEVLLFGSELKALARHPSWPDELDRAALALFLRYGFVPAPWTAYRGIRKLAPGAALEIAAPHQETAHTYWSPAAAAAAAAATPFRGSEDAAAAAFQALFDEAVALRMEADVPLGAFLSGGTDSASVVAAMQAARPGTRSFCIGFPDSGFDESPAAAAVAQALGTAHTTLRVSEPDCLAVLPRLPEIYDEPFADASQVPTAILCRLTRGHVTVALSGDGGDELFGGYDRYGRTAAAWQRLAATPRVLRQAAGGVAAALAGRDWRPARRLRKLAEGWAHETPESLYRDQLSRWRPSDGLTAPGEPATTILDAPLAAAPSPAQAFMLRDAMSYLPDDLLVKVDRAAMAVALEVRAPLLDPKIAAFAWSLPPELADGKRVMRQALKRRLPAALVDRPKHGFEPPIARWLREGLRDWADDLLSPARLARNGIVDPALVARRWSAHRGGRRNWGYALWPVLMLEAWLAVRGESRAPAARHAAAAAP